MYMRIVWGRIVPGKWNEFEAAFKAAMATRGELKGLRVAAFVVRTVREQMRFDTTRLVVEAGKDFEVTFENEPPAVFS